jgi:hypothetical protein
VRFFAGVLVSPDEGEMIPGCGLTVRRSFSSTTPVVRVAPQAEQVLDLARAGPHRGLFRSAGSGDRCDDRARNKNRSGQIWPLLVPRMFLESKSIPKNRL